MTNEDRENLARAYEFAWKAIKRRPCVITIEPNGWFTRSLPDWSDKKRASELLNGLVELTQQLEKKMVAA
jgi:hypothetical protein